MSKINSIGNVTSTDPKSLIPPSLTLVDNATSSQPTIIKKEITQAKPLTPLRALQQQFSLLNMDGKMFIVDFRSINRLTAQGVAAKLALSSIYEGTLLLRRALRSQFQDMEAQPIIQAFLESPLTACHSGIEFNPSGTSPHYLNLYVGPTITPKKSEWKLIAAFFLEIVCDGDEDCYRYFIFYIAHALQRPWEKPGVMIAMLSGQGTGKGTVARILRKIWSATFLHVHNIDAVTGNFNASLERAFIVFMDEALFSGDRRASDALKSLVTEPIISINEKHQPSRQTASYHRFFAATNAEHFKNTERDDRRDLVLRLSEKRKGDHDYWKTLNAEIDGGGVEAMVYDMLEMDISEFNIRAKPNTKELLEQKLQSLQLIPRWWHDVLYRGDVMIDVATDKTQDYGVGDIAPCWPIAISTAHAIESIMHVSGGRTFKKPSAEDVVKILKELCPRAEHKQVTISGRRNRGFILPSLEQARADFEIYIGAPMQWPETIVEAPAPKLKVNKPSVAELKRELAGRK